MSRLRTPAADLHRLAQRGDLFNKLGVGRSTLAGAVEVNDMEHLRALVDPALRRPGRVVVKDRLSVVIALDQPHAAPAADIDRGEHINHVGRHPAAHQTAPLLECSSRKLR